MIAVEALAAINTPESERLCLSSVGRMPGRTRSPFFKVKEELEPSATDVGGPTSSIHFVGASAGLTRASGTSATAGGSCSRLSKRKAAAAADGTFHGLSITTRSKVKHSKSTSTSRVTIKTEVKVEEYSGNGPSHVDGTPPTSRRIRKKVKLAGMADDVAAGPDTTRRSPRVKEAKLESSGIRIKASPPRRVKPSRSSRACTKGELQQQQKRVKVEEELHAKISPILMERARLIVEIMDALYPKPPIPINHVDNFTLLCGVLLSAQTTDVQVNEVTRELFRVAPDPSRLSKMSQEEVQRIIRSVGLAPTKAKHLIALSQQLLDRFDGEVPSTFEGLQSLPGVGRKTASVVMVQAFGVPAFPVDTHIHRLALRWGLTKYDKNPSKVEEDLMAVFPRESWCKLHLQFIYFGREHCQAKTHETSMCPICSWVKKTGPDAPKTLSDLGRLREFLACPTPPKKSSKNAIFYSERLREIEQAVIALHPKTKSEEQSREVEQGSRRGRPKGGVKDQDEGTQAHSMFP